MAKRLYNPTVVEWRNYTVMGVTIKAPSVLRTILFPTKRRTRIGDQTISFDEVVLVETRIDLSLNDPIRGRPENEVGTRGRTTIYTGSTEKTVSQRSLRELFYHSDFADCLDEHQRICLNIIEE